MPHLGSEEEIKIILNASSIAGLVEASCETVQAGFSMGAHLTNKMQIIEHLNKMEDAALKLEKLILKGFGYDGPTGKMLS